MGGALQTTLANPTTADAVFGTPSSQEKFSVFSYLLLFVQKIESRCLVPFLFTMLARVPMSTLLRLLLLRLLLLLLRL